MNIKENRICHRIIDTWKENIEDRIELFDAKKNDLKMHNIFMVYQDHLKQGKDENDFRYTGELTEEGWELYKEIKYFLPSYVLLHTLARDTFRATCHKARKKDNTSQQ